MHIVTLFLFLQEGQSLFFRLLGLFIMLLLLARSETRGKIDLDRKRQENSLIELGGFGGIEELDDF